MDTQKPWETSDDEISLNAWRNSPRHPPSGRLGIEELQAATERRMALNGQLSRMQIERSLSAMPDTGFTVHSYHKPKYVTDDLSAQYMRAQLEGARQLLAGLAEVHKHGFTDANTGILHAPQMEHVIDPHDPHSEALEEMLKGHPEHITAS